MPVRLNCFAPPMANGHNVYCRPSIFLPTCLAIALKQELQSAPFGLISRSERDWQMSRPSSPQPMIQGCSSRGPSQPVCLRQTQLVLYQQRDLVAYGCGDQSTQLIHKCQELNFTNEGGVSGTTRLLKNISGLWPYQQCRAAWQRRGKNLSWDQITQMAADAKPLQALFNADDPSLIAPDDMVVAIQKTAEPIQR